MSEAEERLESPQEEPAAAPPDEGKPEGDAPPEPEGAEAERPARTPELSGATMDALARADGAEETERKNLKERLKERLREAYGKYQADGRLFKGGLVLAAALLAALAIVIAGTASDRRLGVVLGRAAVGFCVSGAFMGAALYWLDRFGIPLFIAKHSEQIQMAWLGEAEESEAPEGAEARTGASEETPGGAAEALPLDEDGLMEVLPQEGASSADGGASDASAAAGSDEDDGLAHAVVDDAFSPVEENEEPPSFAPMTAERLESVRAD